MKIVSKIFTVLLFIIFFGFALNNTESAKVQFFLDYSLKGPLALILMLFFIGGAILGIFAMLPTMFRYRRDLTKQKKHLVALELEMAQLKNENNRPPQPDSV